MKTLSMLSIFSVQIAFNLDYIEVSSPPPPLVSVSVMQLVLRDPVMQKVWRDVQKERRN